MPEFIRLPNSIINLSHVREIEIEGEVVLVHWVGRSKHLILRGEDAEALLRGLEERYGLLTHAVAIWENAA